MIRAAKPEEASFLTELAVRSKAHWGYSAEFLAACREELGVSRAAIIDNSVFVLELDGRVIGFYSLEAVDDTTIEIGHLFVDPHTIRRGYGRALMKHAVSESQRRGYRTILIQGDPNAEGFYQTLGARKTGTRASASIPGRQLPLFELSVS
jgi:GNAT superfamily N-acetyltransferase